MDHREDAVLFGIGSIYTIASAVVAMVALIAAVATWYGALPWMLDARRDAVEHSRQFVVGHQAALVELGSAYRKLDTKILAAERIEDKDLAASLKAQQVSLLDTIRREAQPLNPNDIPADVRRILQENP
jgi:hypothetical protein